MTNKERMERKLEELWREESAAVERHLNAAMDAQDARLEALDAATAEHFQHEEDKAYTLWREAEAVRRMLEKLMNWATKLPEEELVERDEDEWRAGGANEASNDYVGAGAVGEAEMESVAQWAGCNNVAEPDDTSAAGQEPCELE